VKAPATRSCRHVVDVRCFLLLCVAENSSPDEYLCEDTLGVRICALTEPACPRWR
jgi:hypothetical protein